MSTGFWRKWVYDRSIKPDWQVHPHDAYGILARLMCAILGSIVPIGMALLGSGVLHKLEEGTERIGVVFLVACALLVVMWIIGIIFAVNSEEKKLTEYILLGSVFPANIFVIALFTQVFK